MPVVTPSSPAAAVAVTHPSTPHPQADAPPHQDGGDAEVAAAVARVRVSPSRMDTAAVRVELKELRVDIRLNKSHDVMAAALRLARTGGGPFKPAAAARPQSASAAAMVLTPQWTLAMSCRLIEVVLKNRNVIAMMAGGFTREHLDTPSPSPWSVIEEEFNYVTLIAWEEPADGCEDLAAEVLLLPIDAARRTWSYLKNKWASIKSEYTLPLSRWTASGQGDPEAVFADFQSAQDSHPKVALYLHHRLASLRDDLDADSLASMDGMVSRLIRVDAISDNGSKKRGSVEEGAATASKRVTSSGGFLDNASEADLTRLFSAAPASPPVDTTGRLAMFMAHYDKLESPVRADVGLMIAEEAAQLRLDLHAQHQRRRLSNSPPGDGDEAEADESDWQDNQEPGMRTVEVEPGEVPAQRDMWPLGDGSDGEDGFD